VIKKINSSSKHLAQLNKEKSRLKINDNERIGDQMDIEVDIEDLKYNAEEMRKKMQNLKISLRELRKNKNVRADPALIEQREQTLNDFKSKARHYFAKTL